MEGAAAGEQLVQQETQFQPATEFAFQPAGPGGKRDSLAALRGLVAGKKDWWDRKAGSTRVSVEVKPGAAPSSGKPLLFSLQQSVDASAASDVATRADTGSHAALTQSLPAFKPSELVEGSPAGSPATQGADTSKFAKKQGMWGRLTNKTPRSAQRDSTPRSDNSPRPPLACSPAAGGATPSPLRRASDDDRMGDQSPKLPSWPDQDQADQAPPATPGGDVKMAEAAATPAPAAAAAEAAASAEASPAALAAPEACSSPAVPSSASPSAAGEPQQAPSAASTPAGALRGSHPTQLGLDSDASGCSLISAQAHAGSPAQEASQEVPVEEGEQQLPCEPVEPEQAVSSPAASPVAAASPAAEPVAMASSPVAAAAAPAALHALTPLPAKVEVSAAEAAAAARVVASAAKVALPVTPFPMGLAMATHEEGEEEGQRSPTPAAELGRAFEAAATASPAVAAGPVADSPLRALISPAVAASPAPAAAAAEQAEAEPFCFPPASPAAAAPAQEAPVEAGAQQEAQQCADMMDEDIEMADAEEGAAPAAEAAAEAPAAAAAAAVEVEAVAAAVEAVALAEPQPVQEPGQEAEEPACGQQEEAPQPEESMPATVPMAQEEPAEAHSPSAAATPASKQPAPAEEEQQPEEQAASPAAAAVAVAVAQPASRGASPVAVAVAAAATPGSLAKSRSPSPASPAVGDAAEEPRVQVISPSRQSVAVVVAQLEQQILQQGPASPGLASPALRAAVLQAQAQEDGGAEPMLISPMPAQLAAAGVCSPAAPGSAPRSPIAPMALLTPLAGGPGSAAATPTLVPAAAASAAHAPVQAMDLGLLDMDMDDGFEFDTSGASAGNALDPLGLHGAGEGALPPLQETPSPVGKSKDRGHGSAAQAGLLASIPLFVGNSISVNDSMALDRQSMSDVMPFKGRAKPHKAQLESLAEFPPGCELGEEPSVAGLGGSPIQEQPEESSPAHHQQHMPMLSPVHGDSAAATPVAAASVGKAMRTPAAAAAAGARPGAAGSASKIASGAKPGVGSAAKATPSVLQRVAGVVNDPSCMSLSQQAKATPAPSALKKGPAPGPATTPAPTAGYASRIGTGIKPTAAKPAAPAGGATPLHAALPTAAVGARSTPSFMSKISATPAAQAAAATPAPAAAAAQRVPAPATPVAAAAPAAATPVPAVRPEHAPQPQQPASWNTPLAQIAAMPLETAAHIPLIDSSPFLEDWAGQGDTMNIAEEAKRLMSALTGGQATPGAATPAPVGAEAAAGPQAAHHMPMVSPSALHVFKSQCEVMTKQLVEAQVRAGQLEKDNEALRDAISTMQFEKSMQLEGDSDMERSARIYAEEQLAAAKAQGSVMEAQVRAQQRELADASAELASLRQQLGAERAARGAEAQAAAAGLQQAQAERDAARAQAEPLSAAAAAAQAEAQQAKGELETERKARKDLQEFLGAKDMELHKAVKAHTETQRALDTAVEQLTNLRVEAMKQAKEGEAKVASVQSRVASLQQEREGGARELAEALQREAAARTEAQKLTAEVAELKKSNKELVDMCEHLLGRLGAGKQ